MGKWCCFVSAGWKELSWQKLSAVARTSHVQPGWGTLVAAGRPAAVWCQGGSVPAAAAFLNSTLRPAGLLSWPGLPASSPPACSKFPCLWAYFHPECKKELWNHLCLYGRLTWAAQALYLDKVSTASSGQQQRIYREASVAHAIINSVFPIRLYAFWFGLWLTPLTAGCACCWLVCGIQGWEHVPILSRVSALLCPHCWEQLPGAAGAHPASLPAAGRQV